jgi:hypothetical protein
MTDHETFLLLAAKQIGERLSDHEEAALTTHLASCPSCRATMNAMRRDDILLRGELGVATVSPRVRQRVLDEAAGVRRFDRRLILALAAALLVGAIGVPLIVGGPSSIPPPEPSPSVGLIEPSPSDAPTFTPTDAAIPSASVEPSPAPVPTGAGPFINGNYTYQIRRDSIAARLEDGNATGEWWRQTTVAGKLETYSGPITCLRISGKDAWLAGRTTAATDGREDVAMFFHLHDGGPNGDGDEAVGYLANPGQTLATMESWCESMFVPTGPFPLSSGDVVVDEDG